MYYRLVYCSRNTIAHTASDLEAEIRALLLASRRNNEAAGITGALIFNGKAFAQVLEGPRDAVDLAFAKIRFDPRHTALVLLEEAYQPVRNFPNWSMAYADSKEVRALTDVDLGLGANDSTRSAFASRIMSLLQRVLNAHLEE